MAVTIFYSWQSDSPSKTNHRFIKEALEIAVNQLLADGHVEEAPRVDHDTQGVHGDPDIFPTILKKIEECDVFLADVTIVASTSEGKNVPNPNVLLELGYAYKTAGSGRIIKIMNASYGDPDRGLPFDLAHKRWPYTYTLAEDENKLRREQVKEKVAKDLAGFIRLILENEGPKDETAINVTAAPAFNIANPKDGEARFRSEGKPLGIHLNPHPLLGAGTDEVFLSKGPAMWLRLFPTSNPAMHWPANKLKESALRNNRLNLPPLTHYNISFLRAGDGFGVYSSKDPGKAFDTDSVAFVFETGEIWSIDTSLLDIMPEILEPDAIKNSFAECLEAYGRFLISIGVNGPYRWICGLEGVKNRRLQVPSKNLYRVLPGPPCLEDVIIVEGVYDVADPPGKALRPFFELLFRKCGEMYTGD